METSGKKFVHLLLATELLWPHVFASISVLRLSNTSDYCRLRNSHLSCDFTGVLEVRRVSERSSCFWGKCVLEFFTLRKMYLVPTISKSTFISKGGHIMMLKDQVMRNILE